MNSIKVRFIAAFLVTCLVISIPVHATPIVACNDIIQSGKASNLDYLDIWLIVGNQIICETNNEGCNWNEKTRIVKVTPLFDLNSSVIAYYVVLSDGGYMVINNSSANPVVLEYSYSIDVLKESSDYDNPIESYCYLSPGIFVNQQEAMTRSAMKSLGYKQEISYNDAEQISNSFISEISIPNEEKKDQLEAFRRYAQEKIVRGSGDPDADYGFFYTSGLPTSSTTGNDWIPFSRSLNHYGTTGEFAGLLALYTIFGNPVYVQNHCASVSAFNMLYYYRYIMNDLLPLANRTSIYLTLHSYIRNGPVVPNDYGSRFASYIDNETNYTYDFHRYTIASWSNYVNTISADLMAFIVAWPSPLDSHTFNGIGYITYSTSEKYCRVVDGWNNSPDRFYLWSSNLYALGYIEIS